MTDRRQTMVRLGLIALMVGVWGSVLSAAVSIADETTETTQTTTTTTTSPETTTTEPVTTTTTTTTAFDNFDNLIEVAPRCWEDEVIVLVIWDPYGDLDDNNVVGCVPADNLPVNGYRP